MPVCGKIVTKLINRKSCRKDLGTSRRRRGGMILNLIKTKFYKSIVTKTNNYN